MASVGIYYIRVDIDGAAYSQKGIGIDYMRVSIEIPII
jgi:hypothetical protein